jgi:phosphoribosylaminoimidazolecarboxamide formyltransferase/IMP cyclohydrolase
MADVGPSGALTAPGVTGDLRIERALLTVYDKRGLVDFARALTDLGVEIISTGGTASELAGAGIDARSIEDYTGFPEILDGRVKTLHPSIFAGLLAVRSREEHRETLAEYGIAPIDLVVVNLYPFERTAARRGVSDEEVIEHIDIGGPTLIRAAAKNNAHVGVVVRPESYDAVIEELNETGGSMSAQTRESLATEAFGATARYDAAISRWFSEREEDFPNHFVTAFEKVMDLSYGENPHQRAAYYEQVGQRTHLLARTVKVHGKELSFNNLLDLDSGRALLREFEVPAAAIIKHNNPCGVALGTTPVDAYVKARETDPVSAFGGVIAFNRPVDLAAAKEITSTFVEVVIAPGFAGDALVELKRKKDLRLLDVGPLTKVKQEGYDLKKLVGGLIVQDRDLGTLADLRTLPVPTVRKPTDEEYAACAFAWKVCKHVKSNAIIYAKPGQTVGIGAGQMSRVDSVKLAAMKAQLPVKGCVMASDAFFPFRDGLDAAAQVGITAVIQPGGSIRDAEVVKAADEHGMAMILTGMRHFRH